LDIIADALPQDALSQPISIQDGYVVHNTFIDSIRPPLTPSTASAHKRSKSLPRDLGSKNEHTENYDSQLAENAVLNSPALTASPWTPHSRHPENAPLLEISRQVLRLSDFV